MRNNMPADALITDEVDDIPDNNQLTTEEQLDRAQSLKSKINKAREKVGPKAQEAMAPVAMGTSNALRWAWLVLIPSWGLSLIYINIHVFLYLVLGEKFFCKLGHEWIPKGVGGVRLKTETKFASAIAPVEWIVLGFLDLLAIFFGGAVLGLLVMICQWFTAGFFDKIQTLWGLGWDTIKALVQLFVT